jgi:hypothetical protein
MSFQLSLELPPQACLAQFSVPPQTLARRTDPETSKEAAKQAKALIAHHHALIVSVLREYGPGGKDFIASRSKLDGVQVARRTAEMCRLGLIRATGNKSTSTAGRPETEYEVVV